MKIRPREKSEDEYLGIAAVETAVYPENASTVADFKHADANWDANYLRELYVATWVEQIVAFAGYSERFRAEVTAPILNKVGQFLRNPLLRTILSQTENKLDLRRVLDQLQPG